MISPLHKLRYLSALLPLSLLSLPAAQAQSLPVPDHIVFCIFENHGYSMVMNASRAPHMMSWAADTNCAVFSNLTALTHPSQPNYLYLYSGSAQGCIDDDVPTGQPFKTPNLGAELIAASKTFSTYSEDMPSVGYNNSGFGDYARKHNPAANWMGSDTNQVAATTNQPWTAFPTPAHYDSLPTVAYVVPNEINDMHDGNYFTSITTGDTWIYNNLDSFRQWAMTHNSLLVITYDEDEGLNGNKVATMFYGPMVKGGRYNNKETLINVLGTIEAMYGLGHAGAPFPAGITDTPITYCWRQAALVDTTADTTSVDTTIVTGFDHVTAHNAFTVAPNPATDMIAFYCNTSVTANVAVTIIDVNGRIAGTYKMDNTVLFINTSTYTAGVYYYRIFNDNGLQEDGSFVISSH